jgi:protein-S-isoprenylcysteine O-methyltransferase
MTSIRILWLLLSIIWITAEITLASFGKARQNLIVVPETATESKLWRVTLISLALALSVKNQHWLPISIAYLPRQAFALILFAGGLCLRYYSIVILGRLFTTAVTIHAGHHLIVHGPYRWVRHPAYSGLLITFAAAGLAMGDVLAVLILTVPLYCVLLSRIAVEERMLSVQFGEAYESYKKTTAKLFPKIY